MNAVKHFHVSVNLYVGVDITTTEDSLCEISGCHSGEYEEQSILGYNAL
jgi:hypothetical protein